MSTVNRLTGFATGLDTDEIVKSMMNSEQTKIDRVYQQQTLVEWKQEEYRNIIGEAKDLYSKYFDILSPNSVVSSGSFSTTTVSSSNNSVITAKAGGGAVPPNYNFEVKSLATSPEMKSSTGLTKQDKLGDLGLSGEATFKINYGKNSSTEPISISEDDTVESLVAKIKAASGADVKVTFSEMTGGLVITTPETGESSKLSIVNGSVGADGSFIEDGNSNALAFLGINGSEVSGADARVIVSDLSGNQIKEIQSQKNSFIVDNVTYSVNGVGSATLTSSTDTNSAVDKMKSFINDYNDLVGKIYSNTSAKKNYDYEPLTEAQKEEMTEKEIENWEKKAKEGMLRGDKELTNMLNSLNSVFSGALADYGVKLSTDYTKPGQLTLDEDVFKKSLVEDGEKVSSELLNTFTKLQSVLKSNVGSSTSTLVKKAGIKNSVSVNNNFFSEEIKKYQKKSKELAIKFTDKETKLYNKFANLESIMNKYNSQMSYFSM